MVGGASTVVIKQLSWNNRRPLYLDSLLLRFYLTKLLKMKGISCGPQGARLPGGTTEFRVSVDGASSVHQSWRIPEGCLCGGIRRRISKVVDF